MSDAADGATRGYVGTLWTGPGPGVRIRVEAASRSEAEATVEAEHGPGHLFTLWNEAEAATPVPVEAMRSAGDPERERYDQRCAERLFGERFDFLAERGARVEDVTRSSYRELAYVFDGLTFELAAEWRDDFAAILVVETVEGHPAEGFIVHDGRRVRRNLPDAMADTGLDGDAVVRRFRSVRVLTGPQAIIARLELIAAVLEPCVDHLLAHPELVFPPAP